MLDALSGAPPEAERVGDSDVKSFAPRSRTRLVVEPFDREKCEDLMRSSRRWIERCTLTSEV